MVAETLLVGSALGLLVSALYLAIAGIEGARAARSGDVAMSWFAMFWALIGIHALAESTWALSLAFLSVPLTASVAVLHLKILTGVAAFFGLVYYLLVVYTGRRGLLLPLVVVYLAIFFVVTLHYVARDPIGHETRAWFAGLIYANDGATTWPLIVGLLFAPPLFATGAYALLVRAAVDSAQRKRIAVTALGLGAFFGSYLFGWLNDTWEWWGLVERLVALGTALAVLIARRATTDAPAHSDAVAAPAP